MTVHGFHLSGLGKDGGTIKELHVRVNTTANRIGAAPARDLPKKPSFLVVPPSESRYLRLVRRVGEADDAAIWKNSGFGLDVNIPFSL
jgi:hypothetical protein